MKRKAFKQGGWTGLCGPYSIANALALLFPGELVRPPVAAMVRRMTASLDVSFHAITRWGTDRAQMGTMLEAAAGFAAEQGWPAWCVEARHPRPGMTAQVFWDELAQDLAAHGGVAIVGLGGDDAPNTIYEPHWTCVERIGREFLVMRDSDEYDRVRRSRTGIRPERGWDIEDCFILRPASDAAGGRPAMEIRQAA